MIRNVVGNKVRIIIFVINNQKYYLLSMYNSLKCRQRSYSDEYQIPEGKIARKRDSLKRPFLQIKNRGSSCHITK